jgi:hypothetical protein
MTADEVAKLRKQIAADRKLIKRAAQALGEIDRGPGLSDEHSDVLVALRIRIEGKERASLEDLLSSAGDVKGRELSDIIDSPESSGKEWPEISEKKRDWPGT